MLKNSIYILQLTDLDKYEVKMVKNSETAQRLVDTDSMVGSQQVTFTAFCDAGS